MSHVGFVSDTTEVWEMYPTFSGKLAFDIGANQGMITRILAENFESVVALEPATESYEDLVANLPPNARAVNMAASRVPGDVELTVTTLTPKWGELFTMNRTMQWGKPIDTRVVTCTTLDQLTEVFGYPDFVKIDTEGHEVSVLAGGDKVFFTKGIQYVIEIHSRANGEKCQRFLHEHGQDYRLIRHEVYKLSSEFHHAHYWLVST